MKKKFNGVLYVLNIAIIAFAAEPRCPVCSKCNNEEMLLERVIRNELALEQTLKGIKETNTMVMDALRKLQDENDKVNKSIESMERKQILMEATMGDLIKAALANVSQSLSHIRAESGRAIKESEGRVERLKGQLTLPKVHFRAHLASTETVETKKDVVFTRVDVTEGHGYDKGTGKFTVSVAGLYNFVVHYCTAGNRFAHLEIVHNGKSLQWSGLYGASGQTQCSSMQTNVGTSIGDIVWVRSTGTSDFSFVHATTFSGLLIRA